MEFFKMRKDLFFPSVLFFPLVVRLLPSSENWVSVSPYRHGLWNQGIRVCVNLYYLEAEVFICEVEMRVTCERNCSLDQLGYSRETNPVESYFKEWAQAVVEAGKSEICQAGWQAGSLGQSPSALQAGGRIVL